MTRPAAELVAAAIIAAIAGYFLWEAQDLLPTARLAPVAVSVVVGTLAIIQIFVSVNALVRASRADGNVATAPAGTARPSPQDATTPDEPMARSLPVILLTFGAFAVGIWLLGFRVGSALTTLGFLRFLGGERWTTSLLIAGGVYATFLIVFDFLLGIPFPPGLVGDALGNASIDVVLIDWISGGFLGE